MESGNGLAKKIKDLRALKGLTQEALARASGVNLRTIKGLEAGSSPTLRTLKKLAAAFDMPVAYFVS